MIRLLIIDDHPVINLGFPKLFDPSTDGILISGSALSVKDAIKNSDSLTFDIILLDLWLKTSEPLENVKNLNEAFPGKPIIIFTCEDSTQWKRKMIKAGVTAYLLKSSDLPEIKATIELVSYGNKIYPVDYENNQEWNPDQSYLDNKFFLTHNQRELVIMISSGFTLEQIADKKKVSTSTVEKTMHHLREIFGAHNNSELIKKMFDHGLIVSE